MSAVRTLAKKAPAKAPVADASVTAIGVCITHTNISTKMGVGKLSTAAGLKDQKRIFAKALDASERSSLLPAVKNIQQELKAFVEKLSFRPTEAYLYIEFNGCYSGKDVATFMSYHNILNQLGISDENIKIVGLNGNGDPKSDPSIASPYSLSEEESKAGFANISNNKMLEFKNLNGVEARKKYKELTQGTQLGMTDTDEKETKNTFQNRKPSLTIDVPMTPAQAQPSSTPATPMSDSSMET